MEIEVSKFPWAASGRALTLNRTDGLTKIIAHRGTGRLVGVGIVGPQAGELISESVLAIEMGATAEDMAFTIHPHPTLTETLMEAAEGIYGASTHLDEETSGKGFAEVTAGFFAGTVFSLPPLFIQSPYVRFCGKLIQALKLLWRH